MNFSEWLKAHGYDEAQLTASQRKHLEFAWKAETQPPPVAAPIPAATPPPRNPQANDYEAERALILKENQRVERIRSITLEAQRSYIGNRDKLDRFDALCKQATDESWTVERFEVAMLREERSIGPLVLVPQSQKSAMQQPQVMEAALLMSTGYKDLDRQYRPEVLDAAHTHFRNLGLQQLMFAAAGQNGYHARPGERLHMGNIKTVLRHAFNEPMAGGGPSNLSLSGILGNVANKQLVAGYMEEDDTWREVSSVKVATNFYTRTYYRMLDNFEYEEVGHAGEIKHGSVDQESYTAQLRTYAKMFGLTRQDLINDDLGAFNDLRTRLGRGAKKKFNNLFWTNFLAGHSTFFTTARGNYITGSTTTLLVDGVGLALGLKAFRQMKTPSSAGSDDGGKRINARPAILLVPPELEYAADQLFMGEKLNVGSGPGDQNIYRGKYRPVVNAWLSDSAFTGYSTTAWYLFRAATDLPMMAVSFLNGNENPTIESADADFDTLGVQFRGYHDFYADQAEYLCGVKSKGAS